jgi:Flp pilus assembly protein TadG
VELVQILGAPRYPGIQPGSSALHNNTISKLIRCVHFARTSQLILPELGIKQSGNCFHFLSTKGLWKIFNKCFFYVAQHSLTITSPVLLRKDQSVMAEKHVACRKFQPLRALTAQSRRFSKNDEGTTAIEFALVLAPFLGFTFGIIAVGLHYLATNSLERAVYDASRKIRTGQAQQANMNADQFKTMVCNLSAPHINCSKLQIHMSSYDSWAQVQPPNCIDGKTQDLAQGASGSAPITNDVGGASKKVLVTACYDWTVAKYLPYIVFDSSGNRRQASQLSSGGILLQASAVFQTEPYE